MPRWPEKDKSEQPSLEGKEAGVKVGASLYDPKSRLNLANKKADLHYRWVRPDNVDRRRMMGYETVQDAGQADGVKSFTGRKDGSMHSLHDLVLMATRKENAEAYMNRASDKSRARMKRDMEGAKESLNRASGSNSKGYFFGSAKTEGRGG